VTKQFISILEKEKEQQLIPFLKTLSDEQKKELSPEIKKLSKEYLELIQVKNGNLISFRQKATEPQRTILLIASFVCLSRAEFEKTDFPQRILNEKILLPLLEWFSPPWLSNYIDKQARGRFTFFLSYNWIMELQRRDLLHPTEELIVRYLPQIIHVNKNRKWLFTPERLLQHAATLEEHVWYLFQFESSVNWTERYLHFGNDNPKEETGWIAALKKFSSEGKIDRQRLLKEALLASNRNFNKSLSGWFVELFNELKPTASELLNLQPELLSVLTAPHSKPINTSLQYLKKLAGEKEFDTKTFLDQSPVLLSNETKNIVASTLMLLEQLAKRHEELRPSICRIVTQVFIRKDDELQTRAAKIIDAYRTKPDDSFANELKPFFSHMMTSARDILKEFEQAGAAVKEGEKKLTPPANEVPVPEIPSIENVEDLLFLASQSFDNNQSWHIDVLPAALIKLQRELNKESIIKLEPALQRALKLAGNDFRSNTGLLDHMLAIFFIDVCLCLMRSHPDYEGIFHNVFSQFDQKKDNAIARWMNIRDGETYLSKWNNDRHDPFYIPHKELLLEAYEKIKSVTDLPLLSTPTHEPGWIAPEVLVERIAAYEKAGKEPGNMDLQVAISRCLLKETDHAAVLVQEQLTGEFRNLLLFLFGEREAPSGSLLHASAWMSASLARREKKTYQQFEKFSYTRKPFENYTGQFQWESVDEEFITQRYDYNKRKNIEVKDRRKILRLHISKSTRKESGGLQKFFTKFFSPAKEKEDEPLLYDYMNIKATYLYTEHNDVKRILLLAPNNPEPFLAQVLNRCLQYPVFWTEGDKRMVVAAIETLYELWSDMGNLAHVFLGTCMLSSDKTVLNIAGEIWLKAVTMGKINNKQLGKAIGIHERIEFAPLKRFTDLVIQNLFRVSSAHDKNLQELFESILAELPDVPIKNLKKLLEIYLELLASNNSGITEPKIILRLNVWKTTTGLQKIIIALLDR